MSIKVLDTVLIEFTFEIRLATCTAESECSILLIFENKLIFLTRETLSASNLHKFLKSSNFFDKNYSKDLTLRKSLIKVMPIIGD